MSLKKKGSKPNAKKSSSPKPKKASGPNRMARVEQSLSPERKPIAPATPQRTYELGRPTKYEPRFCEELIEFARQPGGTFHAFAAELLVARETLYLWAKTHPDFMHAKKVAADIQERVMYEIGLKGMQGKISFFSSPAWIFSMKARHGWTEEGPREQDDSDMEFDYE